MSIALTAVAGTEDTAPHVENFGVPVSGNTGNLTVPWPLHEVGDIGILVVQSSVRPHALATANGFAVIANTQNGSGAQPDDTSVGISLWWKRAVGGDADPVVDWPEFDHVRGLIFTIKGALASGDPFDGSQSADTGSTTATSIPGGTSTVNKDLIVGVNCDALGTTNDNQITGIANTDLRDFTVRHQSHNDLTVTGPSGILVVSGVKDTAGAYGATTGTLSSAFRQCAASFAIKPLAQAAPTVDEPTAGSYSVDPQGIDLQVQSVPAHGAFTVTESGFTNDQALGVIITDQIDAGVFLLTGQDAEETSGTFSDSGFWSRVVFPPAGNWTKELPL
jgi:hypothetical protein